MSGNSFRGHSDAEIRGVVSNPRGQSSTPPISTVPPREGKVVSSFKKFRDFSGGAVVKNPSANAGDTGSSPGPGRSQMPWGN